MGDDSMPYRHPQLWLVLASVLTFVAMAAPQDQPSLGDIARQARQQKQQNQDAQAKDGQGKPAASRETKVITDESLPEHTGDTASSAPASEDSAGADSASAAPQGKLSAGEWKARIQAKKSVVDSLQSNIDELEKSIRFAPGNCTRCVEWNQRQRQKQQEVGRMRGQLESARKQLEDMQDSARKQGYGNSVYEP